MAIRREGGSRRAGVESVDGRPAEQGLVRMLFKLHHSCAQDRPCVCVYAYLRIQIFIVMVLVDTRFVRLYAVHKQFETLASHARSLRGTFAGRAKSSLTECVIF